MSPDELLDNAKEILKEVYSGMNYDRRLSSPDHTRHQFIIKPQLDKAVADFKSCGFKIEYLEKILAGVLLEKRYAKNVLALSNKLSIDFDPHYLYYLPYDEIIKTPEFVKIDFTKGLELVKSSVEMQLDAFRVFVTQLTISQLIAMFEKMYLFYDKPKRYAIVFKEIYDRYEIKQNDSSERDEELFKALAPEIREFLEKKDKSPEQSTTISLGGKSTKGRKSKSTVPLVINGMDELRRSLEAVAKKEVGKKEADPVVKLPRFSFSEIESYLNSAKVGKRKDEVLSIPLIPTSISESEVLATVELIVLFEATLKLEIVKEDFTRLLSMHYYRQAIEFVSIAFWYIDFSLDGSHKQRHAFIQEVTDAINNAIQKSVTAHTSIYAFKESLTKTNKAFLNETLFKV